MDFQKKLKTRLYVGIGYIVLGLVLIVTFLFFGTENNFWSSFGFALAVIGIVRVRNYFLITKDQETIRKQQIAENDERNISIVNQARSAAFILYVVLASVAVIVLQIFKQTQIVRILSATVCVLIVIYWISYWIFSKKM